MDKYQIELGEDSVVVRVAGAAVLITSRDRYHEVLALVADANTGSISLKHYLAWQDCKAELQKSSVLTGVLIERLKSLARAAIPHPVGGVLTDRESALAMQALLALDAALLAEDTLPTIKQVCPASIEAPVK